MKKVYRGIVEGNVIRLEKHAELPAGTRILVSLTTFRKEKQEEIKNRQLKLLDTGFHLGKKYCSRRVYNTPHKTWRGIYIHQPAGAGL